MSIEQAYKDRYAAVARAVRWDNKKTNLTMEARRKAEEDKRERERQWMRDAAKAIAKQKFNDTLSSGFGTHGTASVQTTEFFVPDNTSQRKNIRSIMLEVLKSHKGITTEDIKDGGRKTPAVHARHHVWHEIRQQRPDLSLPSIARYFGVDHTTCLHGIRKHAERMGKQNGQESNQGSV